MIFDTDVFIKKAINVHGNRYLYEKSIYTLATSKLIITCHNHGDFMQTPNKHLSGRGCPRCAIEKNANSNKKTLTEHEFLESASNIHGDKYSYSLFDANSRTVSVRCGIHGISTQNIFSHLKTTGCLMCAFKVNGKTKSFDTNEFISRAKARHGDRFDYSKSVYNRSVDKVEIICKKHGSFMQKANNHLNGQGCPACVRNGFNQCRKSTLYVLVSECGSMIKVGITGNIKLRIRQLTSATPFKFIIISTHEGDGVDVLNAETAIHRGLKSAGLSGFNGAGEWFLFEDISMKIKERGL